jgi:hypothetical protein
LTIRGLALHAIKAAGDVENEVVAKTGGQRPENTLAQPRRMVDDRDLGE